MLATEQEAFRAGAGLFVSRSVLGARKGRRARRSFCVGLWARGAGTG